MTLLCFIRSFILDDWRALNKPLTCSNASNYCKWSIERLKLNEAPSLVIKVSLSAQSKLDANLIKRKRRILWLIWDGILCFLWKIYLPDTFLFFHFLVRTQTRWRAQSEQTPTQKFLFLDKRPGRLIGYLL